MRVAYVISALAVLFVPFGCASILGDFSSGAASGDDGGGVDANGPHEDGAVGSDSTTLSDAPASDGGQGDAVSPVDSGSDAPPIQLLLCNSWESASPTVVLQIPPYDSGGGGGNGFPINQFAVEHIAPSSAARIVVATNGPTGSQTTVFTVPESSGGGGGVQSMVFASANLRGEFRVTLDGGDAGTNATGMLVQDSNGNYNLYAIADTNPGNNVAAETPVATNSPPPATGNGGNFNTLTMQLPGGVLHPGLLPLDDRRAIQSHLVGHGDDRGEQLFGGQRLEQ